jgi:hypothetical protein
MRNGKDMGTHPERTYTKAELWVDLREAGKPLRRTIPLNEEQTREFLAFFPEFGKGLSSPDAGGWKAAVAIRLTRPDGTLDAIGISEDFSRWSEGRGDWDVSSKFEPFFCSFFHLHRNDPATE